jgi:xanthine dehydrogenase YagR molybdenum-binding subunit
MRDGNTTLGWGFAAASWPAHRQACDARVELRADGTARVECGSQDIGTGTYTVIANVVSELTALPFEKIDVAIGDSTLPNGTISGGSMATASIVPAIAAATRKAVNQLFNAVTAGSGPFAGTDVASLLLTKTGITDGKRTVPLPDALRGAGRERVAGRSHAQPGEERQKYSFRCFGAHCVEVRWDPGLTKLRVTRVVTAIDAGRIINSKTARNQIEGAVVMGLGMALMEETIYDRRDGHVVNDNMADYHLLVHADMPAIDVVLLDHPDPHMGEFGAKGLGEIGITGIAAAVANAVFHATGKRIRNLPIAIEKLLG